MLLKPDNQVNEGVCFREWKVLEKNFLRLKGFALNKKIAREKSNLVKSIVRGRVTSELL